MKSKDLRIKDDPAIWSKLPKDSQDLMDYLFCKLIEENGAIMKIADKHGCGPYDQPVLKKLTAGQKLFVLIYRLDSQILNGGVTQFCWNAPLEFYDVQKAIKKLAQPELLKQYKRMDAVLEEHEDEFVALWNKGHDVPGMGVQCFHKSYQLLKLSWFDKAYMSKLREKLIQALLKFVLAKKKDFVR